MIPTFGLSSNNELDDEIIKTIVLADELGFDNVWVADHSQYDVFSMLTYLAGRTRNIKLGTAVTSSYTRHPVITASAIATVNEISNGRGVLGLGVGGEMAVGSQLFDMKDKLQHCREAIAIIKQVLTGETVKYNGKIFSVKNYRLRMKDPGVPIYFAAAGPKMLELAGELADGVIINGMGSWPPALSSFLEYVKVGAKRGGRTLRDLKVACWTRIAISEHPEEIVEKIRPVIALRIAYANEQNLKDKYGLTPELARKIKVTLEEVKKGWDPLKAPDLIIENLKDLVTDSMVAKYCLFGTPDDVVRRIKELMNVGATHIALHVWPQIDLPEDLTQMRRETLKTFAEHVIPKFR